MTGDARVLLAIEASQRVQTVALAFHGGSEQEAVEAERRDIEDLLPAIDRLSRRCGMPPTLIEAVVVDGGPGGFTGLRMAHAAAQAMAMARDVPLVQASAAAVAREFACREGRLDPSQPCWVALACKGQEAWVARLDPATDPDAPLDAGSREADVWHPGEARFLIADEHLPDSWARRRDRLGVQAVSLGLDARALLAVGRRLLDRGRTTPAEAMVPLYPREAEAVRLWRQRHAARTDGTPAS